MMILPPEATLAWLLKPPDEITTVPPEAMLSRIAEVACEPPLAGQLRAWVAPNASRVSVLPALIVAPLTLSTAPGLKVTLLSAPPESTRTVAPPATEPSRSMPPEETVSVAPEFSVVPLPTPFARTLTDAPELTVVPLAMPPEETISLPPFIVSPMATPADTLLLPVEDHV
jgi:hypothetical protein